MNDELDLDRVLLPGKNVKVGSLRFFVAGQRWQWSDVSRATRLSRCWCGVPKKPTPSFALSRASDRGDADQPSDPWRAAQRVRPSTSRPATAAGGWEPILALTGNIVCVARESRQRDGEAIPTRRVVIADAYNGYHHL
ncbi:hypothetical protein [Rhodococcus phenolicus]|uniref:hypothetical protein n=1 Tax=Rhodococcus phenolicus TaxID=263849 RepID=UPI0012E80F5C|nr:hypothetical protein [Rhodococcus phenolicus]